MVNFETFKNAPIVEAIVDIRTKLPESVSIEDLDVLHEKIKKEYPKKEVGLKLLANIDFKKDQKPKTDVKQEILGFRFKKNDNNSIVQYRLDGFTFNKLMPYKSWDATKKEASMYWKIYRNSVAPEKVTRLALRYINKIEVPYDGGRLELSEYFTFIPDIPNGITLGVLSDFLIRVTMSSDQTKSNYKAIVTESLEEKNIKPGFLPFILDIDVFSLADIDVADKTIWGILDELRVLKNNLFLNLTTNKAKQLFR